MLFLPSCFSNMFFICFWSVALFQNPQSCLVHGIYSLKMFVTHRMNAIALVWYHTFEFLLQPPVLVVQTWCVGCCYE